MEKVERPQAEKKKIHCKNEFELCYLRHQYIRKVDFNPSAEEMSPYNHIAEHQAKNTYFTYRNLFSTVGMEAADVINIAKMHIVSYLGLFSVEKMPDKYKQFSDMFEFKKGGSPDSNDILNKNKANFTMFLKQRMEDLTRVCRQKVRNIRGFPGDDHYVYVGAKKPPVARTVLINDHEKYGFNKLDIAVFKTIRKRAKAYGQPVFHFNGMWYVSVQYGHENLSLADFAGAGMDPYDSIHNMTPDCIYNKQEENHFWEEKRLEFDGYTPRKQTRVLKKFIDSYKNDKEFKEEVKLARKLLKEIGA